MPRTQTQTQTQDQVYGAVDTPEDIRTINGKIRAQMERAESRDELTELKKRSDYLCALARAPSWKAKLGRNLDAVQRTARDENRKSTDVANRVAERHGWDADYDAWGK